MNKINVTGNLTIKDLNEDEQRLIIRNDLKEHNKKLVQTAQAAGVETPQDYAVFQNQWC